jgi:hypothetical protein
MIKMVLAAILLAGGYLLTPARCPAQSRLILIALVSDRIAILDRKIN